MLQLSIYIDGGFGTLVTKVQYTFSCPIEFCVKATRGLGGSLPGMHICLET